MAKPHVQQLHAGSAEIVPGPSGDQIDPGRKIHDIWKRRTFAEIHAEEKAVHGTPEGEERALCLSGGGIRSATFGLGVLQGLADHELLHRFDYLSTVSGGGYIGSWLTAWIARGGGVEEVEKKLKSGQFPEAEQIAHLRQYSNYLTPKLGPFSADTWALGSIVLRNLILNWLVLLPIFFAALLIPRIFFSLYPMHFPYEFAMGGALTLALLALAGCLLVAGLAKGGKSGLYLFWATIGTLISAAIVFPLELGASNWRDRWLDALRPIASIVPWFGIPVVGMCVLYVLTWRSAQPFSQLVRFVNACVLGSILTLELALLFVEHVLPLAQGHATVRVAYVTPLVIVGVVFVGYLVVGLTHTNMGERRREWLSELSGALLFLALAWAATSTLVFLGPRLFEKSFYERLVGGIGGLAAHLQTAAEVLTAVGGIVGGAFTAARGYGPQTAAVRTESPSSSKLVGAALCAFVLALALALTALADIIIAALAGQHPLPEHLDVLQTSRPLLLVGLFAVAVATSAVCSRWISLNKFSLHAMYRNRLIRAYLGASRPPCTNKERRLVPRYDPEDDILLGDIATLAERKDVPIDPALARKGCPLHLINMALNLLGSDDLAWQERRAESFTASPLFTGFERPKSRSENEGYRASSLYGGLKDRPITLGTVMAISGAAANPNMGYHSSPLVTFVMTLFNARLGWWLGNPGKPDHGPSDAQAPWVRSGPAFGLLYLLREALGRTTDALRFVNLSDGGHFENLGLYEAIRRRCKVIVVVDSGCDPDYSLSDLGNAIRKCRIDFGTEIEFDNSLGAIRQRTNRVAIATITYRHSDIKGEPAESPSVGKLVYIKPMILEGVLASEPVDVLNYKREHPAFPHEPTTDQFFSESQFESYRRLGLHTILTASEFENEFSLFTDESAPPQTPANSVIPGRISGERFISTG